MSNISTTIDQNANYEQAQFHFIHREFAQSADLLTVSNSTISVPPWLLLFALCGRAFSEPDTGNWPFESNSRKKLRELVQTGDLWMKLEESFEAANQSVPDTLIISSFKLAAKYMVNARPVTTFIENAMATNTLGFEVLASYVMEVLVGIERDFYYARELVRNQTNLDKVSLIDEIDKAERKYLDDVSQEREKEKYLEEQRVSEAKEKSAIGKISDPVDNSAQPVPDEELADVGTTVHRPSVPARPHRGLVEFWKQWARQFVRSQGLYNLLIVVAALTSVCVNYGVRNFLRKGGKWMALIFRRGISMALQVTYL